MFTAAAIFVGSFSIWVLVSTFTLGLLHRLPDHCDRVWANVVRLIAR